MQLSEFVEQILFGTTLAEKLADPGIVTNFNDASTSGRDLSLAAPGRPRDLQMHDGPGAAKPPRDDELENENARGRLLHFLANHELLATELMALVLWKFPDAPLEFRRGVLVTLREEQEHTRLYLNRMQELGVEFGSYPLSGHFWRVVEPMQSPMDFVSRLSLTFEQANLDYSQHFAKVFQRIGDAETAQILERIYQDEIGHVQHGLQWFRKWKSPEQTDWDAFREQLTFPMSPQRARGPSCDFNREGRRLVGLDDHFIDSVELFRQSRGRTPTVHWFNPGAESELTGTSTEKDAALLHQLGEDLEHLMVFVTKPDDVLLVRELPSRELQRRLLDAGVELPEFLPVDRRTALNDRKVHNFAPWAWTPKSHELFEPLKATAKVQPAAWRPSLEPLFRKSWDITCLERWLTDDTPDWSTTNDVIGSSVHDLHGIQQCLTNFAKLGFESAIFKPDLSASGRGQRRLSCVGELSDQDTTWLSTSLDQGNGIIEPELDRVLDLSFLWSIEPDSRTLRFLGWPRALVSPGRRYCGTVLGKPFDDCDSDLKRFLVEDNFARLHSVREWLEPRIATELARTHFHGPFGIDAAVCHNMHGALKIKPMIELNPRMTIGHIAIAIQQRLAPGVRAEFRIFTRKDFEKCGLTFDSTVELSADGRWKSGNVLLGDVRDATKLIPMLLIG